MDRLKHVWLEKQGHWAHFLDRSLMKRKKPIPSAKLGIDIPVTTLPVDGSGNGTCSCPMDGNNIYGCCGEAMAAHGDNIFTFGQGKGGDWVESIFSQTALVNQYLKVSGGDNGLDEDDVTGNIWKNGIAGNTAAIIVDHLDVDVTNVLLTQYLLDQFYIICMAWSVPDSFVNNFSGGSVWASAGIPDSANGHFTPLSDVGGPNDVSGDINLKGFYRLWTWGSWAWVSPSFIASVQPECFVVFSPRQFDLKTGCDSKGRHISVQAAKWNVLGGNVPQSVISSFPPAGNPTPSPIPSPVPVPVPPPSPLPNESEVLDAVTSGINQAIEDLSFIQKITGGEDILNNALSIIQSNVQDLYGA